MTTPIRTRFAPSPTGYLHVGSARTALFAWLYAKHQGGTFVLRIEDTDLQRSTQASVQTILEAMEWLGLDYDEGPFYQTDNGPRYQAVIKQLLAEKKAYRCTCSQQRLDALREAQKMRLEKPRYDGHCRNLNLPHLEEAHVVRFKNPQEGEVIWQDMIRGSLSVANAELDDFIVTRSDGSPTYNFTVVVDDADMKMSHVIRGDDHINNTPRQINLFNALAWPVPIFGHVPMILGSDSKRLSKRHGAVSVLQYKKLGFLPHALLNYLVRLGWAHGDQEIFSQEQMIALFSLEAVNSAPAAFDLQKLQWLNQHYIKAAPFTDLQAMVKEQAKALNIDLEKGPAFNELAPLLAPRAKTVVELVASSRYFYQEVAYNEAASTKFLQAKIAKALEAVCEALAAMEGWHTEAIEQAVKAVAAQFGLGFGKMAQPIRVALTGDTASPSIFSTIFFVGQDRSVMRLKKALAFIEQRPTC